MGLVVLVCLLIGGYSQGPFVADHGFAFGLRGDRQVPVVIHYRNQ